VHGACTPPAVTVAMAKGFMLYMVKASMSGRADEIIDLAMDATALVLSRTSG
jgi:hypothetical protein